MSKAFCCFKDELCKCQGDRTDSTISTYCYNLCWLEKRLDGFTETEQPSFNAIMDYMTENKIPLRRQQSSFVAMKVLHNTRGQKEESERYARPLIDVKGRLQNEYNKQERTERQKKNWVDFKDLSCCAKMLRAETYKLDKNSLWTKDEYARAQLAFILTFHLKYPLRRILCTIIYKPENKNLGNVLDDKNRKVIIREHKMQRKYKDPFEYRLDRNMWRLAQLLRKQHKLRGVTENATLLVSRYWRSMSRNSYCNGLKREMSRLEPCKGKSVGCLAIRNSVITHKRRHDSKILEREEFAYNCMHQAATNEMYRCH
jgi:hypothetical protein